MGRFPSGVGVGVPCRITPELGDPDRMIVAANRPEPEPDPAKTPPGPDHEPPPPVPPDKREPPKKLPPDRPEQPRPVPDPDPPGNPGPDEPTRIARARTVSRFAMILVSAVLLTACGGDASAPGDTAEHDREAPGDSEIVETVRAELARDVLIPEDRLEVTVDDGIVTLEGAVARLLEQDRALRVPETIRGVRAVIDRIEVRTGDRDDATVARNVEAALAADPATERAPVDVVVEDGVVLLSGTASSVAERTVVGRLASSVRGVADVRNDVEVAVDVERTDTEIAADIRRRLLFDAWVDARGIDVTVEDGAVRLAGTVGSLHEKRRARTDAAAVGVRRIDDSGLVVVEESARALERDRPVATSEVTDREILSTLESAYAADPRIGGSGASPPEIEVQDGVVSLLGAVDNVRAGRAALNIAERTVGVVEVRDFLRVDTAVVAEDATVERMLREALDRDAYTAGEDITATVDGGEVSLYGEVESPDVLRRAENVAAGVRGVVDVVNRIRLMRDRLAVDDRAVAEAIRDQLRRSPWVDEGEISVTVESGIAVLEGEVETWRERMVAGENALEGGAHGLVNRVRVREPVAVRVEDAA